MTLLAAIAVVAVGVLVYTYFAYPLLIALLAHLFPARVRRDPAYTPFVSALVPVYNARSYIASKVDSLLAQDYPKDRFEIILFSDGSDDGSDEILEMYRREHPDRIRTMRSAERSGKPTGVNAARNLARGTILLMTDIRQRLAPGCLRALVSRFADNSVGAVSGNLVLEGAAGAGSYWKYENWIRRCEGTFRSMVGVTGPIYAVRKDDMTDLPEDIILDDMWVPMRLRLQGRRILFAPEATAFDDAFEDDREFGRKVRTLAGNYQLFARLPALLFPFSNPSWFEVVSHKVLRLLCPWALLALLGSTLLFVLQSDRTAALDWSEWSLRTATEVLLGAQLLAYALALLGKRAGRLGGVARTFVVLNYAGVVGLWRYATGKQRVTW